MVSITGCVLAKNEQGLLEGCLENLRRYTQDIIVVDNGSTDATATIAEHFGCRVLRHPDCCVDNCRQAYVEAARGEWLLVLDADERLEVPVGQLERAIASAPEKIWGIRLGRYDYYGGGRWSYAQLLRLWRNLPEVRYADLAIHNTVGPSILRAGAQLTVLDGAVQHLDALLHDRARSKRDRYFRLLSSAVDNHPSLDCFIGLEYAARGELDSARSCLERALRVGTELAASFRFFAGLLLADLWLTQNELGRAEASLSELMRSGPGTNWYQRGCAVSAEIELRRGDRDKALRLCRTGLDSANPPAQVHLNIAALLAGEREEEADAHVAQALAKNRLLLDPGIYGPGDRASLYTLQPTLLTIVDTRNLVVSHLLRHRRQREAEQLRP